MYVTNLDVNFVYFHAFFCARRVNKHIIGGLLPFCVFSLRNYQADVN